MTIKSLLIIFLIAGIFLYFFYVKTLPEPLKKIWEKEISPSCQKIGEWLQNIWQIHILSWFKDIWQKINDFFKKEFEKRKPVIEQEFEKEKQELKEETSEIVMNLFENFWNSTKESIIDKIRKVGDKNN